MWVWIAPGSAPAAAPDPLHLFLSHLFRPCAGRIQEFESTMLLGRFEHTLDDKGRVILPSAFADELQDGIYFTAGLEGCIYLFPAAEFQRVNQATSQQSLTDPRARRLWRRLYSRAHNAMPDRQRRVVIPEWLRRHAGITDRVTIIGLNRMAEIWLPERWDEQEAQLEEELADEDYFAGLDI